MLKICQLLIAASLCFLPLEPSVTGAPRDDKPEKAPKVEGTEWVGQDCPEQFIITYRFEKGGVLVYHYNGQTYRNGSWKQDGKKIYFESNEKYCETEATIEGEVISGKSWNKGGAKWKTEIYKYTKPK